MRIPRNTGFHNDIGVTAQPGSDQVVVHSTGGQQCMYRQLCLS